MGTKRALLVYWRGCMAETWKVLAEDGRTGFDDPPALDSPGVAAAVKWIRDAEEACWLGRLVDLAQDTTEPGIDREWAHEQLVAVAEKRDRSADEQAVIDAAEAAVYGSDPYSVAVIVDDTPDDGEG